MGRINAKLRYRTDSGSKLVGGGLTLETGNGWAEEAVAFTGGKIWGWKEFGKAT